MDEFKEFLETSTIGGLIYISTTKQIARLFWILVVLTTFTTSFVEIWNLFQDWEKNPIKTTTENLPISKLTLPNITVCPPKNSYLNLNSDIVKSKEVILDNDTRQEFLEYAIEVVQDALHAEIMKNLSILEESDRFNNWYRGYSKIYYPFFWEKRVSATQFIQSETDVSNIIIYHNQLIYDIYSSASSGNITTKYFGENLDEKKVERDIVVRINVYPPKSVKRDAKAAMILKVKKISLQDDDKDAEMKFNGAYPLENSRTDWSFNLTSSYMIPYDDAFMFQVSLHRKVSKIDILNTKQKKMPGFSFLWHYNVTVEEPWAKFRKNLITKHFVR